MALDAKKLKETLGCFTTGVIIACARKKNFFSTDFFHENSFQKNKISQKFEDFWHNFLHTNHWGITIANQFAKQKKLIKLIEWQNFLNNNLLNKIKKLFADEFFWHDYKFFHFCFSKSFFGNVLHR